MPDQAVTIHSLKPVLASEGNTATYYCEDGTKQHLELTQADSSGRLAERLAPVARLWGGAHRIAPEGEIYKVIGVASEAESDDIFIICWLADASNLDMRCWPLNEFQRLPVPTDLTSAA